MSEVHLFFNGFCLYSSTLALKMHSVRAGLVYFQVFKSLKYFMKNKDPGDNLFDRLSVSTSPTENYSFVSCKGFETVWSSYRREEGKTSKLSK